MATQQESKSKTRINPLLREQGEFAVQQARSFYDQMVGNRPSTYVGISPERQQALDMVLAQARGGGSGVAQTALDEYNKTMSGQYLNDNPYLDQIVNRSVSAAGAAPISQAMMAGRFGGGTMANAMADAMQSTAANLYGQNYQQERDRMMAMLDRSGQVDDLQYADAQKIGQVGQQFEQDQSAQVQEQLNQYNADAQTLQTFLSLLQGNPLMGEVTTTMSASTLDPMKIASGAAGGLAML